MKSIAYVGLDVHSEHINAAVLPPAMDENGRALMQRMGVDPGQGKSEVLDERRFGNKKETVQRFFRRLGERYEVRACYEASSCGYVLYRWLEEIGIPCDVIAPSRTPRRPGDRKKTDRLDALKLADYYRKGELTRVHVPTKEEEQARTLIRHRMRVVQDVTRTKNRIHKTLNRHGIQYTEGRSSFSLKHRRFLRRLDLGGV